MDANVRVSERGAIEPSPNFRFPLEDKNVDLSAATSIFSSCCPACSLSCSLPLSSIERVPVYCTMLSLCSRASAIAVRRTTLSSIRQQQRLLSSTPLLSVSIWGSQPKQTANLTDCRHRLLHAIPFHSIPGNQLLWSDLDRPINVRVCTSFTRTNNMLVKWLGSLDGTCHSCIKDPTRTK